MKKMMKKSGKIRGMKTMDGGLHTKRGGNPHVKMVNSKKKLRLGSNSSGTSKLMGMTKGAK